MNKVYIKGVPGRGAEVIAKLESLGGKCLVDDVDGQNRYCIYYIDLYGNIREEPHYTDRAFTIRWTSKEIKLDSNEVNNKLKQTALKKYAPVMVSEDGVAWTSCLYYKGNKCIEWLLKREFYDAWTYIVPLSEFDFNDLESNIEKSIV